MDEPIYICKVPFDLALDVWFSLYNNMRSKYNTISFFIEAITRLPNGQMLNRWLSEKNNSSVVRLRFRGAKMVK